MNKPLMKSSLLVSPEPDGYVVYDIERNQLHELNSTAALLLELCDGQRSIDQITEAAAQVLPENSEAVVYAWVADAEDAGLLIEGGGQSPALEMSADDFAELAEKLRNEGLIQAAYICQKHAVSLIPDDALLHRELAELAHITGKRQQAREAYECYLELVPDDAEVRHLLTSLRDEVPPERVPDECIQQLYQRFASFYESNMCDELDYEGPSHLSEVIEETLGNRCDLNVLDLGCGCGTGLAGLAIKHRAKRLVGVDLSPEMISQARRRDIYDELYIAEVTQWLSELTEYFDLIIACDTFIYFGDLSPVISSAAEHLADGGAIAFSVERAETGTYRLSDNGRYLHHRSYIESVAQSAQLRINRQRQAYIRMEYGKPVDGLYVCLSRPEN